MADKDTELDQLFLRARDERPMLPDDLAVRILTDAEEIRLDRIKPRAKPVRTRLQRVLDGIGGWQGMGGLVAASTVGVWIGFSAPAFLPDPAALLATTDSVYMVADLGLNTEFLEDTE